MAVVALCIYNCISWQSTLYVSQDRGTALVDNQDNRRITYRWARATHI